MNGARATALHFRENDDAKVLIVANKFQTGFDEPRLCAMYVDRKLSGVQAVQTLSRLNRVFPDKPKPMVVDFINEPDAILESFKPDYKDAHIEDEIPANALSDLVDFQDALLHKRAIVAGLLCKNLDLERQDNDDDFTTGIELVGVAVEPLMVSENFGLASQEIEVTLELPGFDGRPVGENSPVQAAFDEAVDQVNQILAAVGIDGSDESTKSAIRASYGILVEDEMVQALAKENDPSQVAGTDAFKTKGFGAIITAARQSNEVYEAITADPDNLDKFLAALAHMIVAAKEDEGGK